MGKRRIYYVIEPRPVNRNRPYIDRELLDNADNIIFVTNDGFWTLREILGMRGIKFRYCYDLLAVFKDPFDSYLYIICHDQSGDVWIYEWIRDIEG